MSLYPWGKKGIFLLPGGSGVAADSSWSAPMHFRSDTIYPPANSLRLTVEGTNAACLSFALIHLMKVKVPPMSSSALMSSPEQPPEFRKATGWCKEHGQGC